MERTMSATPDASVGRTMRPFSSIHTFIGTLMNSYNSPVMCF
jgi:hypothetical protein